MQVAHPAGVRVGEELAVRVVEADALALLHGGDAGVVGDVVPAVSRESVVAVDCCRGN